MQTRISSVVIIRGSFGNDDKSDIIKGTGKSKIIISAYNFLKPMFTYKVVPVGDGSLYGWAKFDEKGARVDESVQHYSSAADAEKAIRTIANRDSEVVEVEGINNVNTDANKGVNLVVSKDALNDRYHGMKPVEATVEAIADPDADKKDKAAAKKTASKSKSSPRRASAKSR